MEWGYQINHFSKNESISCPKSRLNCGAVIGDMLRRNGVIKWYIEWDPFSEH